MASRFELPIHFRDWNRSSSPSIDGPPKAYRAQRPIYKRPWFIGVAVAVLIAIIIAIAVPLAVVLPNKDEKNHDGQVMLPLYIYPKDNDTWAPLYKSLAAKPNLDFVLIINPSSGPGSSQYPDEQYTAALTQLAKYPNVHKVGYVRTGYATRNVTDVISEINVFSGWASKGPAFAMEGIFFDESPHQYSAEAVDFMLKASRAVKDATGLQGAKTVIRNPGVIPDPKFADSRTDISVTFEQSFTEYQTKEADLAAYKDDRKSQCYMVHSIPSMDKGKLRTFVDDLSKRAEYLFVTSNKENYYESFAEDWAEFIDAIPAS